MDDGDHRRSRVGIQDALRIQRRSPLGVHSHDPRTAPGRDVAHALAEHAVDSHHHGVALGDHVHERRLHAGRARSRDGEREGVGGAEDGSQTFAGLVEQVEEVAV